VTKDFEAFAETYRRGDAQVLSQRLVADLLTPVGAYLRLSGPGRPSFLLESVEGGATRGRYSMIGLEPDLIWRCQGDFAERARCSAAGPLPFEPESEPPIAALRTLIAQSRIPIEPGMPPMSAGIFGYLGYDMVRLMERLGPSPPDPLHLPDALLIRPTIMVVFDAVADEVVIVTPVRPSPAVDAEDAHAEALDRLERIASLLEQGAPAVSDRDAFAAITPPVSNTSAHDYEAMVARAKDYIVAGDVFQVVLSQRFSAPFALSGFSLYRALRRINPAPFLCFLDFLDFQIVCSSPEILVRVRDGTVTIRPIAGTRRRGATPEEDAALGVELLADPKERSEHLMLLDLGRNDVGRVADIGSVTVTDSFFLERYSQVMHIVSNVEGRLGHAHDAVDALIAGFPAGTVSGAPKVRAMEIIDSLERDKRGPYGGCIGYFGADGSMDTCIVLRTAIVKDGMMHVQAGAGIVHDSDPASEQQECVNKAKALFKASEEAVRFATRTRRGQ
jgi:anthranilate synthase component 1